MEYPGVQEGQINDTGKLVALEGDSDVIATQLRLLPPSQKILVLPSLNYDLPADPNNQFFDARAFVRNAHTAFTHRMETARSFLRSSTREHPRLVFMNGGSINARSTCIAKICENITNGELSKAETIFNEIVKNGVKNGVGALMRQEKEDQDDQAVEVYLDGKHTAVDPNEDPDTRAMKAADALDRETATLQTGQFINEQELVHEDGASKEDATSIRERIGDMAEKEPLSLASSHQGIFTTSSHDEIVKTILIIPNRRPNIPQKRGTFGSPDETDASFYDASRHLTLPHQSRNFDDDQDILDITAPCDIQLSIPPTPLSSIVIGEACLVDVQSASLKKFPRRSRSVDKFYPSSSRLQQTTPDTKSLRTSKSAYGLSKRPRLSEIVQARSLENFSSAPRTTFVRASETTIRKSSRLSRSSGSFVSTRTSPPKASADRETPKIEADTQSESTERDYFQVDAPVFPVVEDLIIKVADGKRNPLFELVWRSYMNECYPAAHTPPWLESTSPSEISLSPESLKTIGGNRPGEFGVRLASSRIAETDDSGYERHDDFVPSPMSYHQVTKRPWQQSERHDDFIPSPMSYHQVTKRPWQQSERLGQPDSAVSMLEPPTPETPSFKSVVGKLVELDASDSKSVINVQDSLRQLLSVHFPSGKNGYSQYYYSATPETERLWKPVFGNHGTSNMNNEGSTVDQIIALGCEDGVKKDFFCQISGQVEKFGTKKDGANRSAKLDIGYLIANAMQSYHNLALPAGKSPSPLSDVKVLAALLVPHLECYLASNTSTRLLVLQYPASHLSTVVALRNLLGSSVFKIAGILDSLASDPPSMSRPRTPTGNLLSNEAVAIRNIIRQNSLSIAKADSLLKTLKLQCSAAGAIPPPPKDTNPTGISFAKADYLLPSTATDSEITIFLSSIWKCLMDKSAFYCPEPEPKPIIMERPALPPTPPTYISRGHDPDSGYPASSYCGGQSKISRLTGTSCTSITGSRSPTPTITTSSNTHSSTSPISHTCHGKSPSTSSKLGGYAPSIASTRTRMSERGKDDWENFYIGDEDSEDDDFDKMILGRGLARIVPEVKNGPLSGKRDKKKALRWLGLA